MSRRPATRLGRACKAANVLQADLAWRIGIDEKTLREKASGHGKEDWKGRKRFTRVELARIGDYLGISPQWLDGRGDVGVVPSTLSGCALDSDTYELWREITDDMGKLKGEFLRDLGDATAFFTLIPIRAAITTAIQNNQIFEFMARVKELVESMQDQGGQGVSKKKKLRGMKRWNRCYTMWGLNT